MKDYIVRGLVQENNVRVFGVSSTLSCRHGAKDHNCSPLASIAFGRTISAAIMMGAMLKGEEKMTIQINGCGPIGTMMVDADAKGNVKNTVVITVVALAIIALSLAAFWFIQTK